MATIQDRIHQAMMKFTQPVHGNNTEARRAEPPKTSGYEAVSRIPGDPGSTVDVLRSTQRKREQMAGLD